jgi:hypothetical protein
MLRHVRLQGRCAGTLPAEDLHRTEVPRMSRIWASNARVFDGGLLSFLEVGLYVDSTRH